jgi:hypothetical protein
MPGVLLVTDVDAYQKGSVLFIPWACLLKCVFDVDIERCPQRGGILKIVAAIEDPAVIVRILTHPGLLRGRRRAHRRDDSICLRRPER